MFVPRGIAVALTFFLLLYCLLSTLVVAAWRSLQPSHRHERRVSLLLFWLRLLPFAASLLVTFAIVIPSFQMLEPRSVDEGVGNIPLGLGICAVLLITWGCYRVIGAYTIATRLAAGWLEGAISLDGVPENAKRCFNPATPPLVLIGLRRPTVLISEAAVTLLGRDELCVALEHEFAHMRARDNLKKLMFRLCPFPGMEKLERAWSEAAELAADDAAVSNSKDAVDLAAALIKLSRIASVYTAPSCHAAFVTGSLCARVERLLGWNQAHEDGKTPMYLWCAILPLVAALCMISYSSALTLAHTLTEWLVR